MSLVDFVEIYAPFWEDQTDQKPAVGGPKRILRTGSACLLQSSKLPEFQKFFGRRYQSLPVCCKVTSYQSFRSFLVADTNLCLSVAKFQVTRVSEVG